MPQLYVPWKHITKLCLILALECSTHTSLSPESTTLIYIPPASTLTGNYCSKVKTNVIQYSFTPDATKYSVRAQIVVDCPLFHAATDYLSNIVSTTKTDKFLVWLSIAVQSANFLTISPTILTLQTQSLWCGLSTDLFQFCGRPNCPTDFNERSKLCCEAQTCCLSFQTVSSKSVVYSASISYAHCTLHISCKHHVYFLFNTIKIYIKHQLPSLQG